MADKGPTIMVGLALGRFTYRAASGAPTCNYMEVCHEQTNHTVSPSSPYSDSDH